MVDRVALQIGNAATCEGPGFRVWAALDHARVRARAFMDAQRTPGARDPKPLKA